LSAADRSAEAPGERLKITEIFHSLQGEAQFAGVPSVFVRLTGCPLRCHYCDTAYAFHGGEWWTLPAIVARVAEFSTHDVCVTGGEPLAQRACAPLLTALCDAGHRVSLETSGALPVDALDARVIRVVDVKTPGSGESARNLYPQLATLHAQDQVKFVITSRDDYEWSRERVSTLGLATRCGVLFSPSHGQVEPRALAEWILSDRLPVRFQIQLHKYLWGEERGR
jgi:7-carboxy-7-deazaguanine synthase